MVLSSEAWIDSTTKKEVLLVEGLLERQEKSEVTSFTDEAAQKLEDFYEDDLVVATSNYTEGQGFEVCEIVLVEDELEDLEREEGESQR